MNWNSPLADEVGACALGLKLDSTCAVASRYLKSAPVTRAAWRIAPATAGVVPVGSTFMDGFASAGRCAGLARRIRRRPGWKRTVNDCGKRKVNFGRAGRPV